MKSFSLTAEVRTVTGRKVASLRKNGQIPATVYGREVKPLTITISSAAFGDIAKKAGETGLIELTLEGKKLPVLIADLQKDPVTDLLIHVSFHQVNLAQKVKAKVQIVFTGEPKAVTEKNGVLLTILDEVEVEALPAELPDKLTVDVSHLEKVGDQVTIANLNVPDGIEIHAEKEVSLAHIASIVSKQAEETQTPTVSPTEGETPAQTPSEEAPKE